jgi:hypothetical protein
MAEIRFIIAQVAEALLLLDTADLPNLVHLWEIDLPVRQMMLAVTVQTIGVILQGRLVDKLIRISMHGMMLI